MTIEQVIAMIERRGYEVYRFPLPDSDPLVPHDLCEGLAILHRASLRYVRWKIPLENFFDFSSTETWQHLVEEHLAPLSHGQRHMQCRCGTPVLIQWTERLKRPIEVVNGEIYDTPDGGISLPEFVKDYHLWYRLATAGPASTPITTCPRCGAPLIESVRAIDDSPLLPDPSAA